MILKSKNLVLRPYKTKDLEELISNLNDKKVTRFMSGAVYPYTKNDGIKWLKRCHTLKRKNSRKDLATPEGLVIPHSLSARLTKFDELKHGDDS